MTSLEYRPEGKGSYIYPTDVDIAPAPPDFGHPMVRLECGDVKWTVRLDEFVRVASAAWELWGRER